jgi:hypothetical protein
MYTHARTHTHTHTHIYIFTLTGRCIFEPVPDVSHTHGYIHTHTTYRALYIRAGAGCATHSHAYIDAYTDAHMPNRALHIRAGGGCATQDLGDVRIGPRVWLPSPWDGPHPNLRV